MSRHKAWCAECVEVVAEYRRLKFERLDKLAAKSKAEKQRQAELEQIRERKRLEKWDKHGNCTLHGIPPVKRTVKSFCPRCYSASRRKGQRTRKERERQQQHDAQHAPPIELRPELWTAFVSDVFRNRAA